MFFAAQSWTFAEGGVECVLQLPPRIVASSSGVDVHPHREFMNGRDEAQGHLRLRKIVVTPRQRRQKYFSVMSSSSEVEGF